MCVLFVVVDFGRERDEVQESNEKSSSKVSGKVRELDLAQSRVNDTLLRIDAIVEKSACIDGVTKALDVEDYESGASFVRTFLDTDVRYKDSGKDNEQRETLFECKRDEGDSLEEEGLQVYVSYLKNVISVRAKAEFEELVEMIGSNGNGNKVDFVGCLTNLFKDIVLAIEDNDAILRSLCGEDGIGAEPPCK
ncbi:Conserved oligomeric Golgi complex, subunit 4 [Artemisia annua]|uniref:Conserved oligomeric Golgi complex subunit 4 n=1 Tax=Artemisia annua TaxID=35608 RepID=A0A2U1M0R6_ARTAN|nr:Conserved oligomeric Golgi complex, subunit 4 [Artemisia annua]